MANFFDSIPVILDHEGKWSNNPADPGGATMCGITLKTAQGDSIFDLDHDGIVTKDELHNAPMEVIMRHYHDSEWLPIYSSINSQIEATKIFDAAVNVGRTRAHEWVQKVILKDILTGIFGHITLAALNDYDETSFMKQFREMQRDWYLSWVNHKPDRNQFKHGLLDRAAWPDKGRALWPELFT